MPCKLLSCWNKIFQLLLQPSSGCFTIIRAADELKLIWTTATPPPCPMWIPGVLGTWTLRCPQKSFLHFCTANRDVTRGQVEHNPLGAESFRGAPKACRRRRKVPTISQVLSSPTVHLLLKDLRFEHWGAKLVSCPGRHLTLSRAWRQSLPYYSVGSPGPARLRRSWWPIQCKLQTSTWWCADGSAPVLSRTSSIERTT